MADVNASSPILAHTEIVRGNPRHNTSNHSSTPRLVGDSLGRSEERELRVRVTGIAVITIPSSSHPLRG